MSRRIIRNIVIPILQRMLERHRILGGWHGDILGDERLEEWLEKRLSGFFGVQLQEREGHCLELEERISEALRSDPEGFRKLLEKLLADYVSETLRDVDKDEEVKRLLERLKERGPPDRLREQRRQVAEIWVA